MDFDRLRRVRLESFPLARGGALLLCPERLGLLEADEATLRFFQALEASGSAEDLQARLGDTVPTADMLGALEGLVERGVVGGPVQAPPAPEAWPIRRFIVANTSACNLACSYCYNQHDENRPSFRGKPVLSAADLEGAMQTLARLSAGATELELLFLGGEPLLRFDLIRRACELRRQLPELAGKHLRIFLITNATLLTEEVLDFCSRENVHVKVSLDGNRAQHDRNRRFAGGRGTYEAIMDRLPAYMARYTHPCKAVTATVDSRQADLVALVEHFVALGFRQIELTELYGTGDGDDGPGPHPGGPAPGQGRLEENYRGLSRLLAGFIRSRRYVHLLPLATVLHGLHRRNRRDYPCRTGLDSVALFADGSYCPCHHFMGDARYRAGTVATGPDLAALRALPRPVGGIAECRSCWARHLCGGTCYHRALVEADDPCTPYERACIQKKLLIAELVPVYHELREQDPAGLDWYFSVNLYP